jgi:pimeloyl-ACP methyl ester carboxylesterase
MARPGTLPRLKVAPTRCGRLGYVVSGRGPGIVLLNGAGMSLEGWRALYPRIEQHGTVLAWNRAGIEGSDAPRQPPTGSTVLAALRELLVVAGMSPPYLLVGHSLGGLYANLFARLYPREVRGLLLIEGTHPLDHEVLRKHETVFARAIAHVLSIPQAMFRANLHAELECIAETVRQVEAAGPFPEVPLTVVTGGQAPPPWIMSPAAVGARRAHQQELARLSPLGEQVIAQRSGHFPQLSQPTLVLDALARLNSRCPRAAAPA